MEQASPPAVAAAPPRGRGRRPVLVLVLGIVSIAAGFLVVTLLCAVAAIVLASIEFQEEDAGRGAPERRGLAVGGMVCAICALCIWIPVVVAVAISES